jgi:WD40 repeat protein/serine/threonine protein kinase
MPLNEKTPLLERLRTTGLLDTAQLAALEELPEARASDPLPLARQIFQRGWLTKYQLSQVAAGRGAELLVGPYVLLDRLGEGGMGQVFKAQHRHLGRVAALKIIRKEKVASPDAVRRFHAEVRAAAQLSHPNIVVAYDAGQAGTTHFLAMEFVDGVDLARLVREGGPLTVAQACDYARQACLGLSHAKEKGMVHRDIKPHNLLLSREEPSRPIIKILDMGLARLQGGLDKERALTQTGAVIGTPDYLAPEQAIDSRHADIRSDLYSLGCTLYFLLTGRPPFAGESLTQLLLQHQMAQAAPLEQARPDVHPVLAAVIGRLLAKRPEDRYQTPDEAALALEPFCVPGATALPVNTALTATSPSMDSFWSTIVEEDGGEPIRPDRELSRSRTDSGSGLRRRGVTKGRTQVGRESSSGPTVASDTMLEGSGEQQSLRGMAKDQRRQQVLLFAGGGAGVLALVVVLALALRSGRAEKDTPPPDNPQKVEKPVSPPEGGGKPSPAQSLRREALSEAALALAGEGDPKRAPAELVAVFGDARFRVDDQPHFPCFSPDGRLVAVPGNRRIALFDPNGRLLRYLNGHTGQVHQVSFSPDGRLLASASGDHTIRLWDVNSGREIRAWYGHLEAVYGIAFSHDGKTLATGGSFRDHLVRLWDVTTGKAGAVLVGAVGPVFHVAFSPNGRYLAAGAYRGDTVNVWDLTQPMEPRLLKLRPGSHTGVVFSPDGAYLAIGSQQVLKVFRVSDWNPVFEHASSGEWLAFAPDGSLFSGRVERSPTGQIDYQHWDVPSGQRRGGFTLPDRVPWWACTGLSPDGKTMAVSFGDRDQVRLYDTDTGNPRIPAAAHDRRVSALAFSPDGSLLASAGHDSIVTLWDVATGQVRHQLKGHARDVWSLAFSPDGKQLVSACNGGLVLLWDPAEGTQLWQASGLSANYPRVAFSPDGRYVLAGTPEGTVRSLDARNGDRVREFIGHHKGPIRCVAVSADGKLLASGGTDGKVVVRDFQSGAVRLEKEGKPQVPHVRFSPDGRTLFATYDMPEAVIRCWSLTGDDKILTLSGHTDHVTFADIRPDGRFLASSACDGTVRLWDLRSPGARPLVLQLGPNSTTPVDAVVFAPDGEHLATTHRDGVVRLFRLPPPKESVQKWMASRAAPLPGLSEDKWLPFVAGLSPANQAQAVADRLSEKNPGFDGRVRVTVTAAAVTSWQMNTSQIEDISPLRVLKGLQRLNCSGWNCPLTDLSPLQGLPLRELHCGGTKVTDLSPLRGAPLRVLDARGTPLENLEPVRGMPLSVLILSQTRVSDLGPIKGAPLGVLRCWGARGIRDLEPLKGAPLVDVEFHHTSVADLSPIAGSGLSRLGLANLQINDLSPLRGMPLLRLHAPGLKPTALDPLRELPLRELEVPIRSEEDRQILRAMGTLERLNGKPPREALGP